MIGMMYLVLTALLALNISNAVLEKFAVLNNTLSELRNEASEVNEKTLSSIMAATSSQERVKDAKNRAQQVREATNKVIADLDVYKVKLSQEHPPSDGSEPRTMPMEELILNTNIAEEKMLNPRTEFGNNFEKLLTDYQTRIHEITRLTLPKLNRKAEDYEEFKNNPHHKDKDFLHFQFEGTPTMAAITTITQMQTEILENEAMALDTIAKIAEIGILKGIDNYVPMVIPESNIVAAGAKYKAKMFIAASSSGLIPTMTKNGAPIVVAKDEETRIQMGTVEFIASATTYKDDISEQQFSAAITLKSPDTTINRIIKYKVIRPTIRVMTGNAVQLYFNCGNLVNIDVPSLGTAYQPSFTGKGATIVPTDKKSQIMIVPKDNKVFVTVSSSNVPIGTEEFKVNRIPPPHLGKKDGSGKPIDSKNGLSLTGLNQIRISVDADQTFKENAPKDAVYRVRSMEVSIRRGGTFVQTKNVTSEIVDLSDWTNGVLKPGDLLYCNIKSVVRKTFLNEDDKVDITTFENTAFIPIR